MVQYLDETTNARMLAQAITGMIILFQGFSNQTEITPRLFDEELERFAESERRSQAMNKIQASNLFVRCYVRSQILGLIIDTAGEKESRAVMPVVASDEDYQSVISWATELPPRNMGLPWGFTIMALN
jgi:hypothetical protein